MSSSTLFIRLENAGSLEKADKEVGSSWKQWGRVGRSGRAYRLNGILLTARGSKEETMVVKLVVMGFYHKQ